MTVPVPAPTNTMALPNPSNRNGTTSISPTPSLCCPSHPIPATTLKESLILSVSGTLFVRSSPQPPTPSTVRFSKEAQMKRLRPSVVPQSKRRHPSAKEPETGSAGKGPVCSLQRRIRAQQRETGTPEGTGGHGAGLRLENGCSRWYNLSVSGAIQGARRRDYAVEIPIP